VGRQGIVYDVSHIDFPFHASQLSTNFRPPWLMQNKEQRLRHSEKIQADFSGRFKLGGVLIYENIDPVVGQLAIAQLVGNMNIH